MLEPVLKTLPLWLVSLLLLAACVLAREAGALVYRALSGRAGARAVVPGTEVESHIISAVFALLSFIVALTFSIALERHNARGALVTEEANAIGTAYLSAGLLDDASSLRLQKTLREYAHVRVAHRGVWDERADARLAQGKALRARLWEETRAAVGPIRATDQASYFLETVNEVLRIGPRRELAGRAHIPTRIVGILFLYLVAASAVMGYLLGDSPGLKRQATTALILLFAVMIVTVVDIDRPQAGAIRVSQQALEELVVLLDGDKPGARLAGSSAAP